MATQSIHARPSFATPDNSDSTILGLILAMVVLLAFFLFYAIPLLSGDTQLQRPQVTIPERVDLNLNK